MKKIIIAACMALLGCGSVFAQQGKQAIGGNLSYVVIRFSTSHNPLPVWNGNF